MDRKKRWRRTVELIKNVLIVALSCSAVWLVSHIHQGELGVLSKNEVETTGVQQSEAGARTDMARPLRMVINRESTTGECVRYGVQYDTARSDQMFQQVASLLAEVLSSAGELQEVTRSQWELALAQAPGIVFDFQGNLPMEVLVGWLAEEETHLTGNVRRMILTVFSGQVAVYYCAEETGLYYRCQSEIVSQNYLSDLVADYVENGAYFAFEVEEYANLDPDTLILNSVPRPAVYTAVNPTAGGQADLEALMDDLGLVGNSSFYPAEDSQVARLGSDTLRLYENGVVVYQAGEKGNGFFSVPSRGEIPSQYEAVEACRRIVASTLGTRCGTARYYLSSVQETDNGLEIMFNYCLNGSVVHLEQGYAARFLVEKGQITQFWLCLRNYTDSGKTSVVMPVRQAVAVMEAQGLDGMELLLVYSDTGSETVTASWEAIGSDRGER
ncbi:MAG: hypothetical protein ACOX7N_06615 [Lawsonibacter sp.]|jgi:hypothetical protein